MKNLEIKSYGLNITLTPFINIIGLSNSGKTTMLKMLINLIYNPEIYLDGKKLQDYDLEFKRRNIAACFANPIFNTTYVKEELLYYQDKCGFDLQMGFDNLEKIAKFFGIEELTDVKLANLSIYDAALIKILSLLIINPSILGIDNLFSYLNEDQKLKIIKYAKENNVSILNVTSNAEELLYGTDIIVIENHKVKAYDKTKTIVADEKLLLSAGFASPFVVGLSDGLRYYDLLNKKYYDSKQLVGAIWK